MASYAIEKVVDNSRYGKMSIIHEGSTFYVTKADLLAGVTVLEMAPDGAHEMLERIGTKGCVLTVTAATRDIILNKLEVPTQEWQSLGTRETLTAAALEVDIPARTHSSAP